MKAHRFLLLMIAVLTVAGLVFSRLAASLSQEKARTKESEKDKQDKDKQEKEKTKLFQLNPVVIDVVEYLRDKEIPNMTVIKTDLFPMTIGVTLDTALERQTGVDVQRIQEVGTAVDDDSIKIRGMGARRIKVLRNGRPLNSSGVAGGYFIDWTMIPLTGADRVEVVKGVGDPRFGNVLGGVINLVPKRLGTESPVTELQASAAIFGTTSFNLFHGYKTGAFEYSLAGGYSRSDGYLRNGGMNLGSADLHLGYDFTFKGRLAADFGYATAKKGFAFPTGRRKSSTIRTTPWPCSRISRLRTERSCTAAWARPRSPEAGGKRRSGRWTSVTSKRSVRGDS